MIYLALSFALLIPLTLGISAMLAKAREEGRRAGMMWERRRVRKELTEKLDPNTLNNVLWVPDERYEELWRR